MTGVVSEESGAPLPGVVVTARWRSWEYVADRLVERDSDAAVRTDRAGGYAICGVPLRVQLTVEVRSGRRTSSPVLLSAAQAATLRVDLVVRDDPATAVLELGNSGQSAASISGVVIDSSRTPVSGAHVTVTGSNASAITGDNGRFRLDALTSGENVLSIRRLGFRAETRRVTLSADTAAEVTWILAAVPVHLAEVVTLGTTSDFELSTGFGERRRRGPGVFIDRSDIESRRPHNLTDLLRTVSGFRVQRTLTRWGYQTTATLDRVSSGSVGCPIDYYVNGHEYTPTSMGIDSDVPAAQIEAIEVYKPSQTPPQFVGMRSRCGAVVIWTRYRAHELDG
ncbi:MAG TPA: carboxypeptidase regulatory-like domain-containing protein [Gemmatimonadaceae bacterium]|nr:carboxypeptidase regulatory-like domain-containing protein [Gemmatimonadaceae bacterium]